MCAFCFYSTTLQKHKLDETKNVAKPLVITAIYIHILLFLSTSARPMQNKFNVHKKINQILLAGIIFPIQAVKKLKNYPW